MPQQDFPQQDSAPSAEQLAVTERSTREKPTRNLLIHPLEHFEHHMVDKVQSCIWSVEASRGFKAVKMPPSHRTSRSTGARRAPSHPPAHGAGTEPIAWEKGNKYHPGYFLIAHFWHFLTPERLVVQPPRVLCNPRVCTACCTPAPTHVCGCSCTSSPHKNYALPYCTGQCPTNVSED